MRTIVSIAVLLACAGETAEAQGFVSSSTPVSELLNRFAIERTEVRRGNTAMQDIMRELTSELRSPAEKQELFDGLANLVRNGRTRFLRTSAVSTIAYAGFKLLPRPDPRVGPLLVRLFEEKNDDPGVRSTILLLLADNHDPAVGLELFRQVLTEEPPPLVFEMEGPQAVMAAMAAGPEGQALLRELREAGTIKSPGAKLLLEELIRDGRLSGG